MEPAFPNVRSPNPERIRQIGRKYGIEFSDSEVEYLSELVDENLAGYERIDELSPESTRASYTDRGPGYRPNEDEDPYNAFVTKCSISADTDGPLSDVSVGIKDHIAVAGIEMTWGTTVLQGYVPRHDATVVTRLLEAGAEIAGKTNLSACMFSGVTSELTATGPVLNPRDPSRSPGGSSSGSAAAVAAGDVDVALGGDQGGSVRLPAAWSGIVGLKPTWGLVPYTGAIAADETLDHLGPMTTGVTDCGRVLDAIAGPDPDDPRQSDASVETDSYTDLDDDVSGLTIGILEEGFDLAGADSVVCDAVEDAARRFEDLGVAVETVSVPWHDDGMALWNALAFEGIATKVANHGISYFQKEPADPDFGVAFGTGLAARAGELPPLVKLALVMGAWTKEQYQGEYYAKARNLAADLTAAYDDALADVDALALPTAITKPPEIDREQSAKDTVTRGVDSIPNNGQFNVTGHPGLSIPCGTVDDLPVGLQLVGEHFADRTLLELGYAFEQAYDWQEP